MNYFNEQSDEPLYELVAKELAHSPRQGLLIKCMAKSEGIESKAKAMYIKVRVSEMKVEIKQRVKKEEADRKEAKRKEAEDNRVNYESEEGQVDFGDKPYPWFVVVVVVLFLVVYLAFINS